MLAGLVGWLIAALIFIFRVFPSRGEFTARPAIIWGAVLSLSYLLWIVGMLNA
jgi:hypothetical protein